MRHAWRGGRHPKAAPERCGRDVFHGANEFASEGTMIDPREPKARAANSRHLGPKLAETNILLARTQARPALAAATVRKVESTSPNIPPSPAGEPEPSGRAAIAAAYRTPEPVCVPPLVEEARFDPAASAGIQDLAAGLIAKVRGGRTQMFGVEALMKEFSLSSPEGVALMCLAESLSAYPRRAHPRSSHPRQARPRRLGRACGGQPVLVRERLRLGLAHHRQTRRYP